MRLNTTNENFSVIYSSPLTAQAGLSSIPRFSQFKFLVHYYFMALLSVFYRIFKACSKFLIFAQNIINFYILKVEIFHAN